MALEDFNATIKYYWYYSAYDNMNDTEDYTQNDFGTGKTNTNKIITKWNQEIYGEQNTGKNKDIWGEINSNLQNGWFVPSRAEWAAFNKELGITKDNYKEFNLNSWYWSSSQYDKSHIWITDFKIGYIARNDLHINSFVRLATIF